MKKTYKGAAALLLLTALLSLTAFRVAETTVFADSPAKAPNSAPVSYADYAPFGLCFDKETQELTFENELVRYFYDGADLPGGGAVVRCDYLNENGTVDVHTVWEPAANQDGSTDLFGRLAGIERYSQEEFDQRDLTNFYGPFEAVTYSSGSYDPNAQTFAERFAKYEPFGIEYVEAESASGAGNVYCNGQLVDTFADITPGGGIFTFCSADGGEIKVQTVYNKNGILSGVKAASAR